MLLSFPWRQARWVKVLDADQAMRLLNVPLAIILLWCAIVSVTFYNLFLGFLSIIGFAFCAAFYLRMRFNQIHDNLFELTRNRKYMVKDMNHTIYV